jgi:hypothetical protein
MTDATEESLHDAASLRKPGCRQSSSLPLKIVFRRTYEIEDLLDGSVDECA